jgi:diguanylate cyclase (GGDEF)-like protein/PAS domain S-box-containing protein
VHDVFPGERERFFFHAFEIAVKNFRSNMQEQADVTLFSYLHLFRQLGYSLVSDFNLSELFTRLKNRLGIQHCFLSAYDPAGAPSARLRLLQAFRDGRELPLDRSNLPFPTAEFIPKHMLPSERSTLIIEPIFYEQENLGILAVDLGEDNGLLHEAISAQVAGAMKNKLQREAIHAAEQRFYDLAHTSSDWLWEIDGRAVIAFSSGELEHILGFTSQEILNRDFFDFIFPQNEEMKNTLKNLMLVKKQSIHHQEVLSASKDGERLYLELSAKPLFDQQQEFIGYRGVCKDITLAKKAEERILHMAFFDPLTGLPNRRLLYDRLQMAIRNSKRPQNLFAIMYIDLDNFKQINDTLGHEQGDVLLIRVAQTVSTCIREGDTLARVGGDEFVLLLPQIQSIDTATRIAERIMSVFQQGISLEKDFSKVTSSIGISVYPTHGVTVDQLIKQADSAMYTAKVEGKNRFLFYRPEMQVTSYKFTNVETYLANALKKNEFVLLFQPIVSLVDGRLRGFETLVRWNNELSGDIGPFDFNALAEETGIIIQIERWVVETATAQIRQWRRDFMPDVRISINISKKRFSDSSLISELCALVQGLSLTPGIVEFEITESTLRENESRTLPALQEFCKAGIGFALDNFGTGYASLNYISSLPFETIKIDGMFIQEVKRKPKRAAVIASVIDLARNLDLSVIAEGVETVEQFAFLQQNRCGFIQGNLISPPLEANAVEQMFKQFPDGKLSFSSLG